MESPTELESKILDFDWENLDHAELVDALRDFYHEFVGEDQERFQDIREQQFEELLDILKRQKLVPDDVGMDEVSADDSSDDDKNKKSKRSHRHRKKSSADKTRERSRDRSRDRSRSVSSDDEEKKPKKRRTKSKYDKLPKKTWKNHIGNVQVTAKFIKPCDYKSLYSTVVDAEANGYTLKVVGSGHSYASLCDTDGVLIDPHSLDRMTKDVKFCLDPRHTQKEYRKALFGYSGFELKDVGDTLKRAYVEVENGITLHNLVHRLKHHDLGLLNMGGYDGQTIVGVISTATHGSGISLSCFPDSLKSLVLISTGKIPEQYLNSQEDIDRQNSNAVNIYRIEPSHPFSKRSSKSKYILVQNDDVFKSVMCNMGTMGIIYSVVLEVGENYFLGSTGDLKTLDYALDLIKPSEREDRLPEILVEKRHVNFYCHVYPIDEEDAVIPGLENDDPLDHADKHPCLVMERYFTDDHWKPRKLGDIFLRAIKQIRLVGEIVADIVNEDPYEKAAPNAVSLMKQQIHEPIVVHYPNALLSGNSKNSGYAAEFCIPISKIVDGQKVYTDEYLHAALSVAFGHIYKEFQDQTGYHTYCVQVRFVKESQAYLAMMHGQDCCMLEFQMINPTTHGIETLQSLSEEFQTNEATKDVIRLHWGLDFDKMPSGNYFDRYEKFDTWFEVYSSLNSKGTFSNEFTRRVLKD